MTGSKYGFLLMQRIFMPALCKYTLARLMEQGERIRAFELSTLCYVTCMEPEEVLPLIISLQAVD